MMLFREQEDIIRSHQRTAPVKVVKLAKELGLKVYSSMSLSGDVSGMIKRDEDQGGPSGYAIYVNGSHHRVRRRFTIAHEIAHFILHQSLIGDGIVEDALMRADGLGNAVEREANAMAADILMPRDLIEKAQDEGIHSIPDLAAHFEVSKDAMSYRVLKTSYAEAQASGRADLF